MFKTLLLQNSSLFDSAGGIEYYQDDLAHLFSSLFGAESIGVLCPNKLGAKSTPHREFQIHRYPNQARYKITQAFHNRFSPSLTRLAFKTIQSFKPNLLVCGHISLAPLVYFISKVSEIPFLSIAYGIECWDDVPWLDDSAFRGGNGILSISHWTKERLVHRGIAPRFIEVVHPQLPTEFENLDLPQKARGEVLELLTIARLSSSEKYKGQDHTLWALKQLKDQGFSQFRYTIQGAGDDRARLETLAKECGLAAHTRFKDGVQSRKDFAESYQACDVYVMPSRYGKWAGRWRGEGFGIVYLEAASFKTPSIAYACGGALDIIRNNETGLLVKPENIGDLAAAIYLLGKDEPLRLRLGQSAHQDVHQRFTRKATQLELRQALYRLLSHRIPISAPHADTLHVG